VLGPPFEIPKTRRFLALVINRFARWLWAIDEKFLCQIGIRKISPSFLPNHLIGCCVNCSRAIKYQQSINIIQLVRPLSHFAWFVIFQHPYISILVELILHIFKFISHYNLLCFRLTITNLFHFIYLLTRINLFLDLCKYAKWLTAQLRCRKRVLVEVRRG